jgi:hypothetical protein
MHGRGSGFSTRNLRQALKMHDHLCQHHVLVYECGKCKKKKKDCPHEGSVSRWHYENTTLIKASGFCYDCGKSLKLNKERNKVV